MLKIEGSEQEILGLGPRDRQSRGEPEEFDKDNIGKLLMVFGTSPFENLPCLAWTRKSDHR